MNPRQTFVATFVLGLAAINSGASAATIDFSLSSGAGNYVGDNGVLVPQVIDQVFETVDTAGGEISASRSTSAAAAPNVSAPNGETALSTASVDASTGTLRSSTTIDGVFSVSGSSMVGTNLFAVVDVASGPGMVTVSMAYDGFWDLERTDGGDTPFWQAIATLDTSHTHREDVMFNWNNSPNAGSADGVLSATGFFGIGSTDLTISATLLTQILAGTGGTVNFSNTAILSIVTSLGTTVTFADDRVLSVDPSAVPLPAALPLLGGALSLLGFFGWRRKRMAAA